MKYVPALRIVLFSAPTLLIIFISFITVTQHSSIQIFFGLFFALISLQLGIIGFSIDRQNRKTAHTLHAKIERVRKDTSRFDYRATTRLGKIEAVLDDLRLEIEPLAKTRSSTVLPYPSAISKRVLFITSNGAGMGHLTRCLAVAIAGREDFSSQFVSLSGAARIVERFGFGVLPYPSHKSTSLSQREWHRRFAIFMHEVIAVNRPDVVIFDGSFVYRGVSDATRHSDTPLIWLRRGLWKEESSTTQLLSSRDFVDAVIAPGDIAEGADIGPLQLADTDHKVEPISLYNTSQARSRDDACRELGLDGGRRNVLIQLGAGNLNDITNLRTAAINAVRKLGLQWEPVVAMSPLAAALADISDLTQIRAYPLAPCLAAFEFGIIASGYNSIHEAIGAGLPCIVIPNDQTLTDNQRLRAEVFADKGYGILADSNDSLEAAVKLLALDPKPFKAPLYDMNGARQAVEIINSILKGN
ncbi:glycosyltransferase [Arthrobacter sp. TB 23]|uniref:glycosyltransferase n=1 Tax=Arthrobacter sp. TB 23 TaxID=494419 RepID=UPI00030BF899|nr:glycosyltransferase [Arthrobacter sp. TB 23]